MPATRRPTRNRINRRSQRARRRRNNAVGIAAFTGARPSPFVAAGDWNGVRVAKFAVGLLLLPLCWVAFETFLLLFHSGAIESDFWRTHEFLFFGAGLLAGLTLFVGARVRPLIWLYVAGHELTHALFAWLCRGKVSEIHISSSGGHILTDRNNFLVSLSPYFFPFYTTLVIATWAILEVGFLDFTPEHTWWLYGAIGLTWMFHLTFTIWMIHREQPDVEQNGKLFSFSVIFLANMVVISLLLVLASPAATFRGYRETFTANTESFAARLWESLQELIALLPV